MGSTGPVKRTNITKTCLHNFDPLKPHFYIVKLGFTGVCIIFLISAQRVPTIYVVEQKCEKYQNFLSENFQFLEVKLSIYLNRRVFVMKQCIMWRERKLQRKR